MVDSITIGQNDHVLEMKEKIEKMYASDKSKRMRKTISTAEAPGNSFFGDNVGKILRRLIINGFLDNDHSLGKVINQRHNTGLDHKGHYLVMAQVLVMENRIPSAHCRLYEI